MSLQTSQLNVGCPVYGCDFIGNDQVIIGGGGGEGRNGIGNKLAILSTRPTLAVESELELDSNHDNPTSVCYSSSTGLIYAGINEGSAKIKEGKGNAHFRVFSTNDKDSKSKAHRELQAVGALDLLLSKDPEQYQKQTRVRGRYAAFTCEDSVYVVELGRPAESSSSSTTTNATTSSVGTTELVYKKSSPNGEDISDISFSPDGKLLIYTTPKAVSIIETKTGHVVQELERPGGETSAEFCRAQFVDNTNTSGPKAIIAVLNNKTAKRGIVLCKFEPRTDGIGRRPLPELPLEKKQPETTEKEKDNSCDQEAETLTKKAKDTIVASVQSTEPTKWSLCALKKTGAVRAARCLSVSKDYIVVDTPDFGVSIFSTRNLAHLKTLNRLHGFAITDMAINASQTQVVTVSAANTVTVIDLPEQVMYKGGIQSLLVALLALLLLLILAILLERMMRRQIVDDLVESSSMLQDDAFDIMDGE